MHPSLRLCGLDSTESFEGVGGRSGRVKALLVSLQSPRVSGSSFALAPRINADVSDRQGPQLLRGEGGVKGHRKQGPRGATGQQQRAARGCTSSHSARRRCGPTRGLQQEVHHLLPAPQDDLGPPPKNNRPEITSLKSSHRPLVIKGMSTRGRSPRFHQTPARLLGYRQEG